MDEWVNAKLEQATVQPSAADVLNAEKTAIRRGLEERDYRDYGPEDLRGVKLPRRNDLVPPEKRVDLGEYRRS